MALMICEAPLSKASGQDFHNFENAIWNVIVTMTTVGYGDFYPKSLIGRLVGILITLWGVFFVSMFVVALGGTL